MNNTYSELTTGLEEAGLEQISEMMIAPVHNDNKQVLIKGVHYSDNIHYSQKDIFYIILLLLRNNLSKGLNNSYY